MLGLFTAGLARAATFRVSPIRLALSASSTSGLLTISNESDETLRFQLTAYRWSQGAGGEMELAASDDVVVFPKLLTLGPRKERKIRVGAVAAFAETEKTYRVFVEELPSAENASLASGAPGVHVLTRMGIPVFLQPPNARTGGAIVNPNVEQGTVRFHVRNNGNVHLMLETLSLRGISEAGETVFDKPIEGWYVLAGGLRQFDVPLPRELCDRVRTVRIEARTGAGALTERLDLRPDACRSPNG